MIFILVDSGYLFFYRYHATKLWYKRAHEYTDDLTMVQDNNYQEMFQKKIKDCLLEKIKKHKTSWEYLIIARDTRRSQIWRHSLIKDYKANRDTSKLTGLSIAASLLKHTIMDLIREHSIKSIGYSTAEADDIVYITKNFLTQKYPNAQFVIIASDADYFQIIDERTSLERLDKTDPLKKSTRNTHNLPIPEAQKIDLLIKIISGDKSDNIPSCFPKCGNKTALKYALDSDLLAQQLGGNISYWKQFQTNQKLIDMKHIPSHIQNSVNQMCTICFQKI